MFFKEADMKSVHKDKFYACCVFLVYIFVNFFTSCKNEPIFAAIEDEVKLKAQSVQGLISGIIVVGDNIYSANPKYVFTKKLGVTGKWSQIDTPGGMCTSLATDGGKVYAAFLEHGVYVYEGNSWNKIENSSSISKIVSGTSIIGTNAKNVVFILDGSSFKQLKDSSGNQIRLDGTLQGGGGRYFGDSSALYSYASAVCSKLAFGELTGIRDVCKGISESDVFVLTRSNVYHYDGTSLTGIKHEVSSPWSLSYSSKYKLVVVGGSQGYTDIQMTGSSLSGAFVRSQGWASSSTPSSSYNQYKNSVGKWLLRPILIADTKDGYIIYAGVGGADSKYTGLWGFYNPGQLEWNRE